MNSINAKAEPIDARPSCEMLTSAFDDAIAEFEAGDVESDSETEEWGMHNLFYCNLYVVAIYLCESNIGTIICLTSELTCPTIWYNPAYHQYD